MLVRCARARSCARLSFISECTAVCTASLYSGACAHSAPLSRRLTGVHAAPACCILDSPAGHVARPLSFSDFRANYPPGSVAAHRVRRSRAPDACRSTQSLGLLHVKETKETEGVWSAALQHPGVTVHKLPEVLQPRTAPNTTAALVCLCLCLFVFSLPLNVICRLDV